MLTVTAARTAEVFKSEKSTTDPHLLDREADALLHLGFRRQAERLAHQAQALREGGA